MAPFGLQDHIEAHGPRNGRFHTIAIDGRAGAGKSSLSRYLLERYPGLVVLHGDDYNEARGSAWFGAPNDALLERDVFEPLRRGSSFRPRRYDWESKAFTEPTELVVASMFCAEACFAFEYALDWDIMLWVELSRDESLERAVRRETAEFGWDAPTVRYLEEWRQWQLQEDAYIARVDPVGRATVVLDGTRPWAEQIE